MNKKIFLILLGCTLLTILIAGCSISRGTEASGPNPVHMDTLTFKKSSITIQKGQVVTLINDVAVAHIIANGTWDGSTPKPENEPGAPKLNNLQINGNDSGSIGPFNTAGTYQIYCTIHVGMKITVVVQ